MRISDWSSDVCSSDLVYLRAAEEAAKVSSYLGKIPQLDPSKENIADGLSEFFGVAAKLQLVSQPETSNLAGELVTRYGEILMILLAKASPVHDLNTDIRIASDFYDRNQAEVARALAEMTQLNESGEKNPARFAALDRSLKNAQEAANHFHAERSKAYAQHANAMREYMIALFQEVRSVARLRSEEHTSELQSLMRISYAVFCLKKKIINHKTIEYVYTSVQ